MIVPFIFLDFINLVLCANESERKLYNPSDSDVYHAFNNYPNLDYENSQASHQNGDGPSLFASRLNHGSQFIELDRFLFHDQDSKLDQSISHFDCMIPDLTTFEKDQKLQLQAPINNLYLTPTYNNQQSSMNRTSFRSIVLPQNSLNSDRNDLISNLQPFPISSGQIQEFQNKPTDLDHTEGALTEPAKSIHKVEMDLDDHKINSKKLKKPPIRRKGRYIRWKSHELNNLLKGLNEYGTDWKRIFNSYEFREGRTNTQLRSEFRALKKRGKVVYTKDSGWKFASQGKLIDLVRGEGGREQTQDKKGSQGDAELVNDKNENGLGNPDQDKVSGVIENFDQEQKQDREGPLFVGANKEKRWVPWKNYEFINLIKGVNMYGTSWKKIHESLEFEQGRTSNNLSSRFDTLKKHGQVTFIEGSGWKFVNEKDSTHLDGNKPSKEQKQECPFFVERAKRSCKRDYLPWKKHELDKLLKGVNKYGRNWKKIFDSYGFEGRTSDHLAPKFVGMENKGQIVREKDFGWKYADSFEEELILRGELRGETFN